MFNNVGAKVQKLAKVFCGIGIVSSIIGGVATMVQGNGMTLYGLVIAVVGSFLSWLSSLSLYAIGEAAENSAIVANLTVKADMEKAQENRDNK